MSRFKFRLFFGALACVFITRLALADSALEKGIQAHLRENYDEAAALLKKARVEDPGSTRAAYYLGLTYKRLQRYAEAKTQLEEAVTKTPKIKEALLELIETLYQLNKLDEAKKWIAVAEEEGIRPAQAAFLKGLALSKEGNNLEAVEAFKKAKELDTALAQSADYQIGVAYLKDKHFDDAKKAFQEVIVLDPNSDVGAYANEYVKAIERRGQEGGRPFHLSAGFFEEYDDNVILKPGDVTSVGVIGSAADWREVVTLDTDYTHRFSDVLSVKLQYDFYYANQHELDAFDLHSHTFDFTPSYSLNDWILSAPVQYNYTWVDGDDFLWTLTENPLANFKINDNQLGQIGVKLQNKSFLHAPTKPDEDRDAFRVAPGASWFMFFLENKGFLGLRYEFDYEDTDGKNWEYLGNRANVSTQLPVADHLKLTVAGDIYLQDFQNTHTLFNVKRNDDTYTLSAMLGYEIVKSLELQLRYTYVKHDSNIAIYEYDRNIYSTGVTWKF